MTSTPRSRFARASLSGMAAVLAGTLVIVGTGGAASAESTSSATDAVVGEALTTIDAIDGGLLAEPVAAPQAALAPVAVGDGHVTVPADPTDGVTFTSPEGETTTIGLPHTSAADDAVVLDDGTVAYPGQESANAVIVADQGVQLLSTITDAQAPVEYSYEFDLSAGERLELVDEGAVVRDANGEPTLAVGSAWAVDANGTPVPTHYEVNGSTLTQIVDHTASDSVAYPVVADPIVLAPWMIKCLVGLGLKGPDITRIASMGTPTAILAAFGRAAVACIFGK